MVRMTSFLILFQFVFSIHNISFSQSLIEGSSEDSTARDKALEFYFLNEQSLAFRSALSENFYWKVGFDLSAMISDEINTNYGLPSEAKRLSGGFKLSSQCFISIYSNDNLSFDVGIGPSLNYLKYIIETTQDDGDRFKAEETDIEYGILTTLSAQFQLSDKIFLLAKYDYGIMKGFETRRYTSTDDEPTSYERDYWQLQLSTIKLGVGIFL